MVHMVRFKKSCAEMYNFLPHKLAANALFDATNEHPATVVHTRRTAAGAPVWHIRRRTLASFVGACDHLAARVFTCHAY